MIKREIEDRVRGKLWQGKAIVLYGARQVGKTTLLKQIFGEDPDVLWLNGDEEETQAQFASLSAQSFPAIIGNHKILVIDEAQRISDIGLKLKIIQDNFGDKIQVVATGSSSFDLANKVNEPMTGRKWTFWLSPLTLPELISEHGIIAEKSSLNSRLIYGSYPDVVTHPADAQEIVSGLSDEDLYKDVLNLGEIIKTDKLRKILQALAFQIGSQVSMNELANLVGLDNKTIDKYISLLEQSFVVFRLASFSRNLRNELKASNKFYFYDCGIRNALIDDFRPVDLRQDIGSLFENYIIAELRKQNNHKAYFWRTSQQQEVDYVAEKNGAISALEIKWSEKRNAKIPSTFVDAYAPAEQLLVNRENYADLFAVSPPSFLK